MNLSRVLAVSVVGIGLLTSCPATGVMASGPVGMGQTSFGERMPDKACCLSAAPIDAASDIPSRPVHADAPVVAIVSDRSPSTSVVAWSPDWGQGTDRITEKFDCRSRMKRE